MPASRQRKSFSRPKGRCKSVGNPQRLNEKRRLHLEPLEDRRLMAVGPALVAIIPNEAATPALVLVGFLMMTQVKNIDWDDLEVAIPAFLTIALMPFTYNITVGIGAGFIAHVLIKVVHGKAREIGGLMWVVAGMFVVYFAIAPIRQLLGVE